MQTSKPQYEIKPLQNFKIMGIINVTPDSFSDGNLYLCANKAQKRVAEMIEEGADIIDLGAESSRPESKPISLETEWQRLEPVLKALERIIDAHPKTIFSIDTYKPEIMLKAFEKGIRMANNIQGLVDAATLKKLSRFSGAHYLAMLAPKGVQNLHKKTNSVSEVLIDAHTRFQGYQKQLLEAGFPKTNIWLDPGIGFGKTDEGNIRLMLETPKFARSYQLAIGISRKSWLQRTFETTDVAELDRLSKLAEFALSQSGARLIRTHSVAKLEKIRQQIGISRPHV